MKLSIIIPVYNVDKYISDCLDSIINQCTEEIEIICINDGSTDNSLNILKEYEKKYNYIYVYSKKNGGLSSARNYGIEKATGEYIFFLDSDDMLKDNKCLSFMIDIMDEEELDILYFDGRSFFENENLHQKNKFFDAAYQRKKSYGIYQFGKNLFTDFIYDNQYYTQISLQCLRKSFIKRNNLQFPEGLLYEDNLFTFKAMILANKVMHQNRIVMLHRIREHSIMQSKPDFHNFYSLFLIYQEMLVFWKHKEKEIEVDKAISITLNGVKAFAKSIFYQLDIEEKNNIFKLSQCDQYLIKNFFEADIQKNGNNSFFPYYLFYFGCRIIIYGGGNVGKTFYYTAIKDKLINIVAVIDSKALEMEKQDIVILPKSMIKELDFDFILIAVENPEVADEIKDQLIDMGVPEYKLKWDETLYFKNNYRRNYEYYKFTNRLIEEDKKRIFLFMLPEHGNLGDHAIAVAEEKFFKQYFSDYKLISMTTNEFFAMKDYIIRKINTNDIIFLHGGGYIGDLWQSGTVFKKIVKIFPNNLKIALPNSLAYKNDYKNNLDFVKEDLKSFYDDKKLFIIFRDRQSYEFYKNCGYIERCFYFPDMVLSLSNINQFCVCKEKQETILLCFRHDEEKVFQNEEKVKQIIRDLQLKYQEKDTHINQYIPKYEEKIYLKDLIGMIKNSSLIITDRLHGMILSTVCGTPCIAFDNSTHKVFSVYEWLSKRENVILCSETELDELPQYIKRLLSIGHLDYKPLEKIFDEMAEQIRKIISKQEE